jgi:Dynamin family
LRDLLITFGKRIRMVLVWIPIQVCLLLFIVLLIHIQGEEIASDNSPYEEKIRKIVHQGRLQPQPLRRSGETGEKFEKFLDAMATLWHIADEYNLGNQIKFTNFVTFGPQSAGKTTLTERILGFPVAVTKTGIGTTRPMIVTTRKSNMDSVKVKAYGDSTFIEYDKKDVMIWAQQQMDVPKKAGTNTIQISDKPIYIDVSGPNYMNRRFVDLPGFQSNDEGNIGTREAILNLLQTEMQKPNTVVLCVEDSQFEYVNSPLILAIQQIFGTKVLKEQLNWNRRFIIALNKSDRWLLTGDVTRESFLNRVYPYVEECGIMPIIVGTPFNPSGTVRKDRESGNAKFSDIVEEYRDASRREEGMYQSFFSSTVDLGENMQNILESRFLGFDNLLGTVDALVIERDLGNFDVMTKKLRHVMDQTSRSIENLNVQIDLLGNLRNYTKEFLTDLFFDVKKIATTDSGGSHILATVDVNDIKSLGNNALTEEIEFIFGHRDTSKSLVLDNSHTFGGYYDPQRVYQKETSQGYHETNVAMWRKEIIKTIQRLKNPQNSTSIDYLNKELVGGKLYERAISVWSSSLYSYLAPTEDDLIRLANLVGTNTEIKDPNRHDFLKATRLMEVYVMRLVPALQYLCQKMEFLLLKIMDTAWRARLNMGHNTELVKLIGETSLREEAWSRFRDVVRRSSRSAFVASLTDLNNDVSKLLPYSTDSAAVSGMLFAFPDSAENILSLHAEYRNVFANAIKKKVSQHMNDIFSSEALSTVLKGIEDGIDMIATAGSIDPLLIAGLGTCRDMVSSTWKRQRPLSRRGIDERMEDRDERLLGFTCVLYSHFLPRFIATIDSRMRRHLWGSVDDIRTMEDLRDSILGSNVFQSTQDKLENIKKRRDELVVKEEKLRQASYKLSDIQYDFRDYFPTDCNHGSLEPVCIAVN